MLDRGGHGLDLLPRSTSTGPQECRGTLRTWGLLTIFVAVTLLNIIDGPLAH
ncbi:MAG: hypothetical protein LKJ87_03665 [Bacteroidales bacterium]|nr:hypothetical protein [Bacteroidales bacterium]